MPVCEPVVVPARPAPVELPWLEELLTRGSRKGSLLVVEDIKEIRELYRWVLEREGYRVHEAGDGVECLRAAKTLRPDLILLNYLMPRMDGLTALAQLKKDPVVSYLKVVMHSALGNDRWLREAALAAGALDILNVPMDPRALIRAVAKNLG